MRIYTIGYEGADIESFLHTLALVEVERVLDIRDVPASRKRDFSKNILRSHLEAAGISYSHFKPLGDPKAGRDAMRSGNRQLFEEIFAEHMRRPEAQGALGDITKAALDETCVLLCYERDYKDCHRTIVAKEMEGRSGFQVQHLGVRKIEQRSRITADGSVPCHV